MLKQNHIAPRCSIAPARALAWATPASHTAAVLTLAFTLFAASASPPPPQIASVTQSGNNLIIITAGATNAPCRLLTSTNLAVPRTNWTAVATNLVGANGCFTNTLPIISGVSAQFYQLSVDY